MDIITENFKAIFSAYFQTASSIIDKAGFLIMLIFPALFLFTLFSLPFYNLVPYLDGATEFNIAFNFFQGKYFSNWMQYHPPIKPIIAAFIFNTLGIEGYSLIGYVLGMIGIVALYFIAEKMFDKKVAVVSSLMLAMSGLYLSTSLFSLNDFLLTVFLLIGFAYYVHKKLYLALLFITLAVLAKETAIFFPISIILVEGIKKKFRFINLMPFIALGTWIALIHLTGHHLWNEWNFSKTADKGSTYTLFYNIVTFSFLNKYAYENWLHLFIFNFNWIFWIFALLALWKIKHKDHTSIMYVFIGLYTLCVLSFQTYTITRYVLPLLPFVYLLSAVYICRSRYYYILIPLVALCMGLSLFTSNDPISNLIWEKRETLNIPFYSNRLDGKDGITYNMQFLFLTKKRNSMIFNDNCKNDIDKLNISKEIITTYHLTTCQMSFNVN